MLNKVNYVDNQTIITAQNLNDIQDSVIALENEEALPSYSAADNGKFLRISNGAPVWDEEEALPSYSAVDNGKFLRISNGVPVWAIVSNAEGVLF